MVHDTGLTVVLVPAEMVHDTGLTVVLVPAEMHAMLEWQLQHTCTSWVASVGNAHNNNQLLILMHMRQLHCNCKASPAIP